MSAPVGRVSVLAITSLTLGLALGCSAVETTNTLRPHSGGSNATGGRSGANATGGRNGGGNTSQGGASTTSGTTTCVQGASCAGLPSTCNPNAGTTVCTCTNGRYRC